MPRFLLISLLLVFCTPALAVYKCEAGGHISYADTPCPGGKKVDTTNQGVAASDASQARQQLARQKSEVRRLERERHQREAVAERQQRQNARAYAAKKKQCASLALQQRWAEDDARKAAGKATPKAVRKARRAAEKYQLACGK
ncbi:MAG: hypothetical protein A3K04_06260 [Gallionellales bacterium RBG_16_56_9]|nr:MAG: hypothetical protein A3K04_06260 [Gallionellales bacterium RBG_16_56_9]